VHAVWSWGIIGLILLALEMVTGTFYVLWFAISALIMALLLWVFPDISTALQIFLFAVFALASLTIWKLTHKETTDLHIGQSKGDDIGRIGTIIEAVGLKQNGRIQFAQGVMGSREWIAVSSEEIEIGADAVIVGIEGNSLRVQRKV